MSFELLINVDVDRVSVKYNVVDGKEKFEVDQLR